MCGFVPGQGMGDLVQDHVANIRLAVRAANCRDSSTCFSE